MMGEPNLRITLVGKTGNGKSASGNTILGRKAFKAQLSSSSVTSRSEKATGEFGGDRLAVVDTPGLFDTVLEEMKVKEEIARCVCLLAPGPHVILIVLQPTRFTAQEQEIVDMIEEMFGEEAARYSMVLFTHGDVLEEEETSIEELIGQNQALETFINNCQGNYHVLNNKDKDRGQVQELLNKICEMVQKNEGSCYTNEMFQEAQRAIEDKMEELIKANPSMDEEEARNQAERDNAFIQAVTRAGLAGAGVGAGVGFVVGGPAGAALGGVVGAVGAAAGVAVRRGCVIQ